MAAQIYTKKFSPAHYIGLKIRKATRTVELQFAESHGDAFAVTIPLGELQRLYGDVTRQIEKAPDLFALASKTTS